jgi:hypothetical protein
VGAQAGKTGFPSLPDAESEGQQLPNVQNPKAGIGCLSPGFADVNAE